jgi:hypothetical protein
LLEKGSTIFSALVKFQPRTNLPYQFKHHSFESLCTEHPDLSQLRKRKLRASVESEHQNGRGAPEDAIQLPDIRPHGHETLETHDLGSVLQRECGGHPLEMQKIAQQDVDHGCLCLRTVLQVHEADTDAVELFQLVGYLRLQQQ